MLSLGAGDYEFKHGHLSSAHTNARTNCAETVSTWRTMCQDREEPCSKCLTVSSAGSLLKFIVTSPAPTFIKDCDEFPENKCFCCQPSSHLVAVMKDWYCKLFAAADQPTA